MRRLLALLVAGLPLGLPAQRTREALLHQCDANGDGKISEAEYVAYMQRGFERMDADHDGMLEPREQPGGHGRTIRLPTWQAHLHQQFRKLDRDHDGYLSAVELTAPPPA